MEVPAIIKSLERPRSEVDLQNALNNAIKNTGDQKIRLTLSHLFRNHPELRESMSFAMISTPSKEFQKPFHKLLKKPGRYQTLAMEHLSLWNQPDNQTFLSDLKRQVIDFARKNNPRNPDHNLWLACLAALQWARIYEGGEEAWKNVAMAIKSAEIRERFTDFPRSIRSEIEAIIDFEEADHINRHLIRLGQPPLELPGD